MPPKKYYVVWKGRETGIFLTWNECQQQVLGYENAVYKSFPTYQLAQQAFAGPANNYIGATNFEPELTPEQLKQIGKPILESLSVDGAGNNQTGVVEYQGVHTRTKQKLFAQGPFEDGTNNIVEFLALVHALAYCKQHQLTLPIYTDSITALAWVRNKQPKTNHPRTANNQKLFDLLDRATTWLQTNPYPNPILKWETKAWGEIPADFGRK